MILFSNYAITWRCARHGVTTYVQVRLWIEAFNWRDHKRRNPIVFPHFIQSMLLAYINSIEPLVASAHAQMQMKQAHCFFLAIFCCWKNMWRPVLFCYRCCYAPAWCFLEPAQLTHTSITNTSTSTNTKRTKRSRYMSGTPCRWLATLHCTHILISIIPFCI